MELNQAERRELLEIAKEAIAARIAGRELPQRTPSSARLTAPRGVFVCLKVGGRLRGCIGNMTASTPLWQAVRDMAAEAAFADPRFMPLTKAELPQISLEISVLSELRLVDDPGEVVVGEHGLYVVSGRHRGVLLPQVATEWGWDRDTFLAETCLKAGLAADSWKKGARIHVFTATVFFGDTSGKDKEAVGRG
ncbi:MAG: AmmeMemoRadiSam system protein A [Pseudomonadota bacterium]